jgi:hypothetical protein
MKLIRLWRVEPKGIFEIASNQIKGVAFFLSLLFLLPKSLNILNSKHPAGDLRADKLPMVPQAHHPEPGRRVNLKLETSFRIQ